MFTDNMPNEPLVSIVVPTKNSAIFLVKLFESLLNQTYKKIEIIINEDSSTVDSTPQLINEYKNKGLSIVYLHDNPSMAQGRKTGAHHAEGEILMHIDSDMSFEPGLVEECVGLIKDGFDALIIPEESYGSTFLAKCKWLEKKCYEGIDEIESLRCLNVEIYKKIGGHNPLLTFSEDKDLDLRVRAQGYKVGRTKYKIFHNEGDIVLLKTMKKKLFYSNSANIFAELHPDQFKWQANIFNRYYIFLKNIKYLFIHPILYIGLFIMKTAEFMAGALGYLLNRKKIVS